jgi:transposase-like protein
MISAFAAVAAPAKRNPAIAPSSASFAACIIVLDSFVSRLGIVLTLSMEMQESHPAYRSQSDYPPREPLWEDRRMTFDESIQGMRLRVIRRAAAIGVSAACYEAGISRTLFYPWQKRLKEYGLVGRAASAPSARAARTATAAASARRTAHSRRRDRAGDVGLSAFGRVSLSVVAFALHAIRRQILTARGLAQPVAQLLRHLHADHNFCVPRAAGAYS